MLLKHGTRAETGQGQRERTEGACFRPAWSRIHEEATLSLSGISPWSGVSVTRRVARGKRLPRRLIDGVPGGRGFRFLHGHRNLLPEWSRGEPLEEPGARSNVGDLREPVARAGGGRRREARHRENPLSGCRTHCSVPGIQEACRAALAMNTGALARNGSGSCRFPSRCMAGGDTLPPPRSAAR